MEHDHAAPRVLHGAPGHRGREGLAVAGVQRFERGRARPRHHGARRVEREDLGRAEAGDVELAVVDDDVAQVRVQLQRARRRVARRGQADEPPVRAGDVEEVIAGVVRHAARRGADIAAREDRARRRRDRHERSAPAKRDVGAARGVDRDASWLVAFLEADREGDAALGEIDHVDLVAIGIGRDGRVPVGHDAQRATADSRWRLGRRVRDADLRRRRRGEASTKAGAAREHRAVRAAGAATGAGELHRTTSTFTREAGRRGGLGRAAEREGTSPEHEQRTSQKSNHTVLPSESPEQPACHEMVGQTAPITGKKNVSK